LMAISFSASASRVFVPYGTTFQVSSYSIWVRRSGSTYYAGLISRRATDNGYGLIIHNNANIEYRVETYSTNGIWRLESWQTHFPLNTWTHLAISHNSLDTANNPVWYVNGEIVSGMRYQGPNNTTVGGGSGFALGNHSGNGIGHSLGRTFPGALAEAGYWNAILTSDEVKALAKGVSPLLIRHNALRQYVPLTRDHSSRHTPGAVLQGTTSVFNHPPVYMPSAQILRFPSAALGPTITSIDPAPPLIVGQTGVKLVGSGFGI
jgi:hypothetical protein